MPLPALLDTSVLLPAPLCDLLLRLAETGVYRPHWSADILVGVHRSLAAVPTVGPRGAARRVREMNEAFSDASVIGYEGLTDAMTCSPSERPILAAAIKGGCQVIVTYDPSRFPAQSIVRYFIQVVHPDDFLLDHLDLEPGAVMDALDAQLSALRGPYFSMHRFLDTLEQVGLPGFAAELRRRSGSP